MAITEQLSPGATPSAIVRYLDRYVVGQEQAKKILAVAVWSHFRRIAGTQPGTAAKSNILLVGPTGTGKTLLCETLARGLSLPFVTASATSLAQTRYVNEEIEAILRRLIERAGGDVPRAQGGIVFIDEIDKLKAGAGSASGESVQHALLKIMEGAPVRLADGTSFDTAGILFICGGAFVGLEQIAARTHSFGFIATSAGEDAGILERLNQRIKPTDLIEFGLIPEFTGRLPVIARFQPLSVEMLVRVMTEPRDCLHRQFVDMLAAEGVELVVEPRVFEQIAEIAGEYRTGARSLRGIFEEMMTPVLYLVPDHPEIRRVIFSSLFEKPRFLGT